MSVNSRTIALDSSFKPKKRIRNQDVKGKTMIVHCSLKLWERLEIHGGTFWQLYDDSGGKKWLQLVLPESTRRNAVRTSCRSD